MTNAALAVAPDLVLPPGFDRLGETIPCGPERVAPAGAPLPDRRRSPYRDQVIELARAGTGGNEIAATLGLTGPSVASMLRLARHAGELPSSVTSPDEPRESKSLRTLAAADFIPCTRCSLRGHLAGDTDRCIGLRSTGLGGAPWMETG